MKKQIYRVLVVIYAIAVCAALSGCCIAHNWVEADCEEPRHCSKCGKTEGESLGHVWQDATCTEAKTCERCGETKGEALGHDWEKATCLTAKTCTVCGEVEGEPIGHRWKEATCTEPKTCMLCGETEGEDLGGHIWHEATCTEPETCEKCGETKGEALGHSVDSWEVVEEATCTGAGEREGYCSTCEQTIAEEIPQLAEEYYWNVPLQYSPAVTVGFYNDGEDYWFEIEHETHDSVFILSEMMRNGILEGMDEMYARMMKVLEMADESWREGDYEYYCMSGYGREWTLYVDTESEGGTLGLMCNMQNELEACYEGTIHE